MYIKCSSGNYKTCPSDDWLYKIENHDLKYYEHKDFIHLLFKPSEKGFNEDSLWYVMQSMREIDTNSFIKIGLPNIRTNG